MSLVAETKGKGKGTYFVKKYVNEEAESPFAVLKSKTFLTYVQINEEVLATVVAGIIAGYPKVMNNFDYRFDKSDYLCRNIDRLFGHLDYEAKNGTIGYDMSFNRHSTLSVKTQAEIFERPDLRNSDRMNAPKVLAIRNRLGHKQHAFKQEDYFDYLWAIQTGAFLKSEPEVLQIRFAVGKYNTVAPYLYHSDNDQVSAKIPNAAWDYLSALYKFKINVDDEFEERKNDIYQTARDNAAYELYKSGSNKIQMLKE